MVQKNLTSSNDNFLFTSESVSEGHPDKIADQISDAMLDAILDVDADARVACEAVVKDLQVFVAGEITTKATLYLHSKDQVAGAKGIVVEDIVRSVISSIGYNDSELGFSAKEVNIMTAISKQSPDIAQGVDGSGEEARSHEMGAGDQGMVFGYACNETEHKMPMPIFYAGQLMRTHAELRQKGVLDWLRPDAKAQVTVRYENFEPVSIEAIVLSTQHHPDITQAEIKKEVIDKIIRSVIPDRLLHNDTKFFINPTGLFTIGGPVADCGLTGRKIIVDTYGGAARHGGGAFSGKDPSKVDRSAAYMARHIAKSIVSSSIAERCELQVAYAIGVAEPVSIYVNCFGTNVIPESEILTLINRHFDLRPASIIEYLQLKQPIYRDSARYGHFGRPLFPWEKVLSIPF